MTTETEIKPTTTSPVPRKLNDAMITALSDAVRKGNYQCVACSLCGISEGQFYEWLKLAVKDSEGGLTSDNSVYMRLSESIKRAEADAESRLVEVVRESAEVKREWLPAITMLERRHRERWGRPAPIQVQVNETKEVHITHVEIAFSGASRPGEVVEGEARELLREGEATEILPDGGVQPQITGDNPP